AQRCHRPRRYRERPYLRRRGRPRRGLRRITSLSRGSPHRAGSFLGRRDRTGGAGIPVWLAGKNACPTRQGLVGQTFRSALTAGQTGMSPPPVRGFEERIRPMRLARLLVMVLPLCVLPRAGADDNWTQFRGGAKGGVAEAATLPRNWGP